MPVPLRWYNILALHLTGKSAKEISEATGCSLPMVYHVLGHKTIQHVRQQLLDKTQQEFEALFAKVVTNIREQLESTDPMVRLAAQQQWFKANGKFAGVKIDRQVNITAEQVVAQILNQGSRSEDVK